LLDYLRGDLKVGFDCENFDMTSSHGSCNPLLGCRSYCSGLVACGVQSGGDWECAVFFVIYWDGKKLRAYIPTDGNPWNTDTREAYGNDDKKDLANAKKRWPDYFGDKDEFDVSDMDFDFAAIERDILSRILPAPVKADKKAAPSKKRSPVKTDALSLGERIKDLVFYGTGDECVELFQRACEFCYYLSGLGDTLKAETVYLWAKEMADESAKEMRRGNSHIDENDFVHGNFP
jgi:hypothetical protein